MEVSRLLDVLDGVISAAAERSCGRLTLLWTGGEPTLWGLAAYRVVFEHVASHATVRVRHLMQSNLIGLDEPWIELLRSFRVGVSTSVDPLDPGMRVFADGMPQYAAWIAAFTRAVEGGLNVGLIFTALACHHDRAEDLYRFVKNLQNLAGRDIPVRVNPVYPSGRVVRTDAPLSIDASTYGRLLVRLADAWDADGRLLRLSPLDEWAGRGNRTCEFSGACARGFLAMDGSYRFAHCARYLDAGRYLSDREHDPVAAALGHPEINRLASRDRVLRNSGCRGCRSWDRCHGGCPFVAELATGDPLTKSPYCEAFRTVFATVDAGRGHAAVS
jgi:radical SAM protein with 4Fe4S-binding SPASM domain